MIRYSLYATMDDYGVHATLMQDEHQDGEWVYAEDALKVIQEKLSALECYTSKADKMATALEEISEYAECECGDCCSCIARETLRGVGYVV